MGNQPDLTEFHRLSVKPAHRVACTIGQAKEQLGPEDRTALDEALAQPSGVITNKGIKLWLERRGIQATISGITSHRAETCNCVW